MSKYATSSLYNSLFGNSKQTGGQNNTKDFFKLLIEKKTFFIMVLSNLIVQLGITYYVMMNYSKDISTINAYLIIASIFILILIIALVPMPSWLKFILFSVFSAIFGLLYSTLKKVVSINIIKTAIIGALGIFLSMFLVGLSLILSGINLSFKFGLCLLLMLIFLIITTIVTQFMGTYSYFIKGLSIFGLMLFSLFIIYDTNKILQRNYYGDFITASMDYYLDILNIFIKLINLHP